MNGRKDQSTRIASVAVCLGLALSAAPAHLESQQTSDKSKPIVGFTSQGEKVTLPAGEISWADEVVSGSIGTPGPKIRVDPRAALGRPNDPSTRDKAVAGFAWSLGHGGKLILKFTDNVLLDVPGPDLAIFEAGPHVEPTSISISTDGKTWIYVGTIAGATSLLDIQRYVQPGMKFRFVRIVDAKAGRSNDTRFAGADIDAVGCIGAEPASMSGKDR